MKRPDEEMFLLSAFALAIICTIQGEEKQHSARWNRTRSAEEAILKVCDIYVPHGIGQLRLNHVWEIIDGPVMDVFREQSQKLKVRA